MDKNTMQTGKKSNVLLMSATITPSSAMPGSIRMDPAVRMNDYIEALKFYESVAPETLDRILFLENSDTDLTPLKKALNPESASRVEFLSVSSDYPPEKGKGYGEFRMFDEGLARASFIRPQDHVWKVTGRLKIRNIARLIRTAPADYEVYCDLRNVPLIGESLGGNRWMELRTFAFRRSAYDLYFREQYANGYVLEKSFFETMNDQVAGGNRQIVPRFRVQPVIDGVSGFSGADYRNPKYLAKEKLRSFTRQFMPWLWL